MIGDFKRFDMQRKPNRQWLVLTPVTWPLSYPFKLLKRFHVEKTGLKGIKPPYLLLCNHNAFFDFMVMTTAIFPHRANYIVAIDGFLISEWLLRAVGCVGTRKFVSSTRLVKNMMTCRDNGDIVVLFPEARYSLCGTGSVLPYSVAKFIKAYDTPVVMLTMHGHHINAPFWNTKRGGASHQRAEMKLLFSKEETRTLSADDVYARLSDAFIYDDFAWQLENKIQVKSKTRAEGLHKILYQCCNCGEEYYMSSKGDELYCEKCGSRWKMDVYGQLAAVSGETKFSHIPDWYEWERGNVKDEVERGEYRFESPVRVDSLANAKGFIDLGSGTLTHDSDGFTLKVTCQGEEYTEKWDARTQFGCHIEFEYKKRGDCIDLNKIDDTLYIYPKCERFSVTKIALATEELYKHYKGR